MSQSSALNQRFKPTLPPFCDRSDGTTVLRRERGLT
jgi:hypothetical protein